MGRRQSTDEDGDGRIMKISFWFDYGQKPEIGTGHKYRCTAIGNELKRRGHSVLMNQDDGANIVVVDFIDSREALIREAKERKQKVVLIDGPEKDVDIVDLSISAVLNRGADHTGLKYMVFPKPFHASFYNPGTNSNTVFIGMGGFDKNSYVDLALRAVQKAGMEALVGNNINPPDLSGYEFARMHDDENYFKAMGQCALAIANGGLTLFQALYYGMPCIPVAQYEHQKINIAMTDYACLPSEPNVDDIAERITWLRDNKDLRGNLSKLAKHLVDGKGIERVCDLIEGM